MLKTGEVEPTVWNLEHTDGVSVWQVFAVPHLQVLDRGLETKMPTLQPEN